MPAAEAGWRSLGASPEGLVAFLERGPWAPLQEAPGRCCYRVGPEGAAVFVKHYRPEGLRDRLGDFLLHRKPWKAFARGSRLAREGFGTPRPVGLFVRGRWLRKEALLVAEWAGPARPWPEGVRGGGLLALARLVGGLHARGYYHGDLAGNLVFGGGGREKPLLVDLEELRRPLSWKRRVKNLEELGRALPDLGAVPLRARWSFLLAYAEAAGLDRSTARRLWRDGREAQLRRGLRAERRRRKTG